MYKYYIYTNMVYIYISIYSNICMSICMVACLFINNKLIDEFDDDSHRYVRQTSPAFDSDAASEIDLKPLELA